MKKIQQKTDRVTGHLITRQYLYEKGYTMSSVTRALLLQKGIEVSHETIRQICRGNREPKPELVEAIKELPKVVVC